MSEKQLFCHLFYTSSHANALLYTATCSCVSSAGHTNVFKSVFRDIILSAKAPPAPASAFHESCAIVYVTFNICHLLLNSNCTNKKFSAHFFTASSLCILQLTCLIDKRALKGKGDPAVLIRAIFSGDIT